MQQPWETGWQPVNEAPPQSEKVRTKVLQENTYHLWKSPQGVETIQKNGQFFQVSPGAFNTIPSNETLGFNRSLAHSTDQT